MSDEDTECRERVESDRVDAAPRDSKLELEAVEDTEAVEDEEDNEEEEEADRPLRDALPRREEPPPWRP
jgi:hypothetical protein